MRFVYFFISCALALSPLEASEPKKEKNKKKDWKTVALITSLSIISIVTVALTCRKNDSPS